MTERVNTPPGGGMNHWIAHTATVLSAFPSWSPTVRCVDLTEEVGELARAILGTEGHKHTGDEEPIALALCGVLFDIFALAEHYGVDLDTEYGEQVVQLAARWQSR